MLQQLKEIEHQEQCESDYQQHDYYNNIPSRTNRTKYNLRHQPRKD